MEANSLEYRQRAAAILRDQPAVRASVTGAALHFDRNRIHGYAGIDSAAWRHWAASVKGHALSHLDQYLDQAERRLEANGIRVHWAATADDAQAVVAELAARNEVRRVVKGKSMLTEELGLNPVLERQGVEVFETDLGEYILQLLDEPPSHILGPAIHRSLADIRQLFHDRFGTPADATPETLAAHARSLLRDAFLTADMGITGANFVVSETGTVALIENEGNIRLATSVPRLHVALAGIEKLLPRWTDLAPFLQLTARAATGQPVGTFVSLVNGPGRQGAEPDGPEEVHVVFVDNGRSRVLADPQTWEVLRCVRCGACLNACPVYRQTGGHAYGWVYSGPLGAVLSPGLLGLEQTHPLPFASTLCGACYEVCPVRIDIPRLLLEWRARAVEQDLRPKGERRAAGAWAAATVRPGVFRAAGRLLRYMPRALRDALPGLRGWAAQRDGITPSRRDFIRLWSISERAAVRPTPRPPGGAAEPGQPTDSTPAEPRVAPDDTARRSVHRSIAHTSRSEPDQPGERRAFAGGVRGRRPASQASAEASRAGSAVTPRDRIRAAVTAALCGRTRSAHPGILDVRDGVATADRADAEPVSRDAAQAAAKPADAISRFIECFGAAGGEVVRFDGLEGVRPWLERFVGAFESVSVGRLVPPELSPLSAGSESAAADTAGLGISMAGAAAAETGTLILDSRDGRRTQLLPPVHLIWVRAGTIEWTLGRALDRVGERIPAVIGLHSGPSRSADIGRVLVTGVHGPGRVVAAVIP